VPYYLLLPLAAAIIYSLGSIVIKRALAEGVTMDQSFHLTNICLGVSFLPLLLWETHPVDWSQVGKPIAMGVAFFVGNWLTFLAIRRGDVSLVTPVLGTKVVFVAIGMTLLTGAAPTPPLWFAAVLAMVGIVLMSLTDLRGGQKVGFTVAVTLASAVFFGLNDVIVAMWAEDFGIYAFLSIGSMTVSLLSAIWWGVQGRPSLWLSGTRRRWAAAGAVLISLQAVAMGIALGAFHDPTGVNVVYASRGIWIILMVIVFGAALGNSEHREAGRGFLWRVVGTLVLTAAIVIAVVERSKHPLS
jgi:drug/metabolite transporter (DMT)-like permease